VQIRVIGALLAVAVVVIALAAWPRRQAHDAQSPAAPATGQEAVDPGAGPGAGDPGIDWTVPSRWLIQPERPMRLATYKIPAAAGDPEDAECAVFYFGPDQGGGVEANIERWVGQFEHPTAPARSTLRAGGLEIARVKVAGTYLAPGGPAMESQGQKPGFELLGAIATGPGGQVFFKLTGPAKTVQSAGHEFDGMLASLKLREPK
jgi:hypothetical protein